jgi:hypothetical protein
MRPIWDDEANSISCADSCIAGGGGDDYDIWNENPELADFINQACDSLSKSDLEGLIEALTAQLKGGVYESSKRFPAIPNPGRHGMLPGSFSHKDRLWICGWW